MQEEASSTVSTEEIIALNNRLLEQNAKLEQQLQLTQFQLEQLKQHVYGRRSEKERYVSPDQETLFGQDSSPAEPENEEYTEVKGYRKKRNSKKKIPAELPTEELVYKPEATHCTECNEALKEFARDIRNEVDFIPARFVRRKHVTVHCACPQCKQVYSGKTPVEYKPVLPGTEFGAGFFAHMLVSKHCDHLPYYRQSQIYEREGVIIPDKSLSRYGMALGSLLEPVAKAIKAELLKQGYLQADETRYEVLKGKEGKNIHRGQIWVLNDPLGKLTYYEYHPGRDGAAAESLLSGFTGSLQTDAYASYNGYEGTQLGCMTHARRYFVKVRSLTPEEAGHVLTLIGKLYKIERELKKKHGNKKAQKFYQIRLKARQEKAVPILEELKAYLITLKDSWLLTEHPLTKAINYMLNRFDAFCVYTMAGHYEIDNNDVERMIRPIAIGRKNWLFAGSPEGAKMAAVVTTVIQSCKQMKINPQQYLVSVLPRLAQTETTSLDGLAPFDWKFK